MADTLETNELIAAQVDAEESFRVNGTHDRLYHKPDDNCCYIYLKRDFKRRVEKAACWDKEVTTNKGEIDSIFKVYGDFLNEFVEGVDCGKDTWITLHEADKPLAFNSTLKETGSSISLAGRIAFQDNYPYGKENDTIQLRKSHFSTVRVGPYDDTIMPAAKMILLRLISLCVGGLQI